ncbi:MAG: WYL domain-containing protein [Clostridia bacterium]
MSKSSNQKMKILCLMRMFLEKTDEKNGITLHELIRMLEENGIRAERKALYDDIEVLREFGIDIMTRKTKTTEYFVGQRLFELAELKLLVDAVQCSKFITHKKSTQLIKKIASLTSEKQALSLKRQVYVSNRIKNLNESIYYNVDAIHSAIAGNKKVSFRYFEYTVDKKKSFRKKGQKYLVSPYALSWDDENYYLITYYEKYNSFTHYRVDRMTDLEVSEERREPLPGKQVFNLAEYSKKFFHMFTGEEEMMHLQFENSLINVVMDRFGESVGIEKIDEHHFAIRTKVVVSLTFYAWLFQFGEKVKILYPEKVAQEYKEILMKTISRY